MCCAPCSCWLTLQQYPDPAIQGAGSSQGWLYQRIDQFPACLLDGIQSWPPYICTNMSRIIFIPGIIYTYQSTGRETHITLSRVFLKLKYSQRYQAYPRPAAYVWYIAIVPGIIIVVANLKENTSRVSVRTAAGSAEDAKYRGSKWDERNLPSYDRRGINYYYTSIDTKTTVHWLEVLVFVFLFLGSSWLRKPGHSVLVGLRLFCKILSEKKNGCETKVRTGGKDP